MRGLAFCPAHITGFFKAEVEQSCPEMMGSLGAGFSIKDGVTTSVNVRYSDENNFEIHCNHLSELACLPSFRQDR